MLVSPNLVNNDVAALVVCDSLKSLRFSSGVNSSVYRIQCVRPRCELLWMCGYAAAPNMHWEQRDIGGPDESPS